MENEEAIEEFESLIINEKINVSHKMDYLFNKLPYLREVTTLVTRKTSTHTQRSRWPREFHNYLL